MSRLGELSRTKRWLLLAVIIILVVLLCYSIFRLSPYLEGFEQYGYIGAFLVTFICSSSVIFPTPGFILIWQMAAMPEFSWAWVALAAAIGGGLGEFTAYLVGYGGKVVIAPEESKSYKRAEHWMRRYGSVTIFAFALAPFLPFDVVGIIAGTLRFPFWKFILATLAGRLPRSFIECYLAHLGREQLPLFWSFLGGLAWWNWVIIGVCLAVLIVGVIMVWQRKRAET
jgi:membrane protein YqaA with SNARE-associated domain